LAFKIKRQPALLLLEIPSFSLTYFPMKHLDYVLLLVFDTKLEKVIGLTKLRGPSFLIGKLTFPGGKVEVGEDFKVAASREMLEETGLVVPLSSWHSVTVKEFEGYSVTVFATTSTSFLEAKTCEDEVVEHFCIKKHLTDAVKQPSRYAPDFLTILELSLYSITLKRAALDFMSRSSGEE
jgi:8-oxo-dGTP pyrophosphatase MutT (NUDIX family)